MSQRFQITALNVLLPITISSTPFTLVYTSNPLWPIPQGHTSTTPTLARPITISVLDSSFNPPTLAHLALLKGGTHSQAYLLLLSTTNADKISAPGETTPLIKLEMMRAMAQEMVQTHRSQGLAEGTGFGNVAVACINEPTFVGKSHLLSKLLDQHLASLSPTTSSVNNTPSTELAFAQGWDTLVRMFDRKYYFNSDESMTTALTSFFDHDRSSIICARRGNVSNAEEREFLGQESVKSFGKGVKLFSLSDNQIGSVSSTMVRQRVEEGREMKGLVLSSVEEIIKREGLYE